MVQLVAPGTAIRTTVYTNVDGRYEFPVLDAGGYTLRIARPLDFKPYVKEGVRIDGATRLDDIVLERVTDKILEDMVLRKTDPASIGRKLLKA